jgi:LacI family transcriptional regulator
LHPFFAEISKALSAAVGKHGYSTIIASSEDNLEMEAKEVQSLTGRQLDALIIASAGGGIEFFQRLEKLSLPYVLIDREIEGLPASFVGTDDEAVGRIATEHLIQQGCRNIAHIRGRENSTGIRRFEGYRSALQTHGIPYSDSLVIPMPTVDIESTRMGAEAMRVLLNRKPIPDAIFAHNDPLAIGAMSSIFDAGLRMPKDIKIIGCGNLHYDNLLRVALSSIDQNSAAIGEHTAQILLKRLESKFCPPPTRVIIPPSLVARESSLAQSSYEGSAQRKGARGKRKSDRRG